MCSIKNAKLQKEIKEPWNSGCGKDRSQNSSNTPVMSVFKAILSHLFFLPSFCSSVYWHIPQANLTLTILCHHVLGLRAWATVLTLPFWACISLLGIEFWRNWEWIAFSGCLPTHLLVRARKDITAYESLPRLGRRMFQGSPMRRCRMPQAGKTQRNRGERDTLIHSCRIWTTPEPVIN